MKILRIIYIAIVSLIGGCEATFAQRFTADTVRQSTSVTIPNGLQWSVFNNRGIPLFNFYQNGKAGLFYTAQFINRNVAFKTDVITINGITKQLGNAVFSISADPNLIRYTNAPVYTDSDGIVGQIAFDGNYFYQCVETNRWKRIPWDNTWTAQKP